MAKLSELKVEHLKNELEQRGLLTSGNKAELQARLREMLQMSSQISTHSSQISSEMSLQSAQISAQMSQMSAELSSQINSQLEKQDTRISKLEAEKTHITSPLETIEAEVDAVKTRLCELQLNRSNNSTSYPKVKSPSFEGTVPFPIFKLQFETTATTNH